MRGAFGHDAAEGAIVGQLSGLVGKQSGEIVLLISLLFAAIYKILPNKPIVWRGVGVGSAATAILFTIGKTAIGLYIGSTGVASRYGPPAPC